MSTMRYSGEIRIRVTYLDPTMTSPPPAGMTNAREGEYRCYLTMPGGKRITIYVGARVEHGSGVGVDSPEAFDDAARASIAFADHEQPREGWGERCAYAGDLSDRHVGRVPSKAWPETPSTYGQGSAAPSHLEGGEYNGD